MSWWGGKNQQPKKSEDDLREEKRKKLEAERQARAKHRSKLRDQIRSAQESREEANQALQDLCNLDPDIFEGEPETSVSEDILDTSEESENSVAVMTNFEDENGTDDDKALTNAIRELKGYEFEQNDLDFYFNQIETVMATNGVKKNYTKFQTLASIIPKQVRDEVKPLLRLKETELAGAGYKKLKDKILKIFRPAEEADFERAMSRVLTGLPSQLARAILNDICKNELDGCCCYKTVAGIWKRSLPLAVKQQLAPYRMSKDTFEEMCQIADDVYGSTRPSGVVAAVGVPQVAAVQAPAYTLPDQLAEQSELNQGFSEQFLSSPQVAAMRQFGGRGRGQFSQRARGRGRGRGNRGGTQTQGLGQKDARVRWPNVARAADLPPFQSCRKHWQFGKNAHWCEEPASCPWRSFFVPKTNQ